jgi:hypothetical protein
MLCCNLVPRRIRRSPRRSLLPAAFLSRLCCHRRYLNLACLHASPRPQHLSHCLRLLEHLFSRRSIDWIRRRATDATGHKIASAYGYAYMYVGMLRPFLIFIFILRYAPRCSAPAAPGSSARLSIPPARKRRRPARTQVHPTPLPIPPHAPLEPHQGQIPPPKGAKSSTRARFVVR